MHSQQGSPGRHTQRTEKQALPFLVRGRESSGLLGSTMNQTVMTSAQGADGKTDLSSLLLATHGRQAVHEDGVWGG